jgi:hypothetical protein
MLRKERVARKRDQSHGNDDGCSHVMGLPRNPMQASQLDGRNPEIK